MRSQQSSLPPGQPEISGPEERLAFALSDGRVGVLAVKGRKVCATVASALPAHIWHLHISEMLLAAQAHKCNVSPNRLYVAHALADVK
jgi:hypothetical protein